MKAKMGNIFVAYSILKKKSGDTTKVVVIEKKLQS
jgi:hypothetical protein